jgi:hypothetical protein
MGFNNFNFMTTRWFCFSKKRGRNLSDKKENVIWVTLDINCRCTGSNRFQKVLKPHYCEMNIQIEIRKCLSWFDLKIITWTCIVIKTVPCVHWLLAGLKGMCLLWLLDTASLISVTVRSSINMIYRIFSNLIRTLT